MARTKKAAKIGKNKKSKKLPFDSTPWDELSKNIKGKFQSKIETQSEPQNKNHLFDSAVSVKDKEEENIQEYANNDPLFQEVNEPIYKKEKKKKIKQPLKINIPTDSTVTHDFENENSDIFFKTIEDNDFEDLNIKSQNLLPSKKLSKSEKKKLKQQRKKMSNLSSPISNEESETPVNLKTIELLKKKKLQKKEFYERKRLERRKELGIMLLPEKIEKKLLRVRKALRKKNLSPEEIKNIMRKERSKAQDDFRKSHAGQICFNCRKPGHLVADCPSNEDSKNISICLKCGSSEHKYGKCKDNITGFPFATCFICKEQGHISRDCPKNEHGIYPKGGKCNLCDSINHLGKDCPTLKIQKGSSIKLYTIDNSTSIDDEVMDMEEPTQRERPEKPKVVTF